MAVFRPLIFLLLLQLGQVLAKPYDYNGSRKPVLFPQPADNQIGKMVMRPSLINNSEEHQAVLPGRSGAGTEPTKSFPVMSLYDNPITVNPPHSMFGRIGNHPVSRGNILDNPDLAVGTNKYVSPPHALTSWVTKNRFYANPYLGSQTQATWTLPYQLVYTKGGGFNGVAVNHIDSRLVVCPTNRPAFFIHVYGLITG